MQILSGVFDGKTTGTSIGLFIANTNQKSKDYGDIKDLFRPAQLVPETQPINLLFESMRDNREHMALAIDEYGQVAGLITLEDLIEEIVGDIADESDQHERPFRITGHGDGWQTDGLISLSDLEHEIGFDASGYSAVNTLAGLLMAELQQMPGVGDVVVIEGFRFEVAEVSGSRINRVLITRQAPQLSGDDSADNGN